MNFRPCIDVHNGQVQQIVGGTLTDVMDNADINFMSTTDAGFYAQLYKDNNLQGGHVINLNPISSRYYEANRSQIMLALRTYQKGLQVGGGIDPSNAALFLDAGASHVIVTSYVFDNGIINEIALNRMVSEVGAEHLVLDLSCRARRGRYYIVTNRWQKYTEVELTGEVLRQLAGSCSEFLVHAADVEGLCKGIQKDVVSILSESPVKATYAGGIATFADLDIIKRLGKDKVDFTVGSALDIFGGKMKFTDVINYGK